MVSIENEELARNNWLVAAQKFKFKIITPFEYNFDNETRKAFAFLPAYGSQNGMAIGLITAPEFVTDQKLIAWAKQNNCFYSFINVENFLEYNEANYTSALDDWSI